MKRHGSESVGFNKVVFDRGWDWDDPIYLICLVSLVKKHLEYWKEVQMSCCFLVGVLLFDFQEQ